jgi:hypothetical protein
LKRLENEMRAVEEKKIDLLVREKKITAELKTKGHHHGIDLDQMEARFDYKARERERRITQLYTRKIAWVREKVMYNEGAIWQTKR